MSNRAKPTLETVLNGKARGIVEEQMVAIVPNQIQTVDGREAIAVFAGRGVIHYFALAVYKTNGGRDNGLVALFRSTNGETWQEFYECKPDWLQIWWNPCKEVVEALSVAYMLGFHLTD